MNVFVVFPGMFLRGRNGFRDGERFGTCLRNGFLGVPKFMNSGFRIVGSVSRCSEMMIKIGYGKWTTPTQVTYTLYLFNKLGKLTGANESLFFEWLRSCGVVSPWQLCLHCLQDIARCLQKSFRSLPFSFCATSFGRQHFCYICCSTLPSTCA